MRLFVICSISVFFLFSCSDEVQNYPVGSDFIENNISIKIIDTFSIKAGTFKLDSLITSSTNRILIGSINDDNFGHLIAQSYFQVRNSDFSINTNAVYDSIGLVLNYDKYYYGDTTQVQTYKVHRLLEFFEPEEGDEFYNTSKLKYDQESLGELSFIPRPNKTTDSLYIPLRHVLGEEIFNKIRNNDINNTDDFIQYFKGITIIPDTLSSSNILGFDFKTSSNLIDNSSMRLFFTEDIDDSSEGNNQVIDFYVSSSSKQFNSIQTNLNNTLINNFTDNETIIPSSESNNLIFAQAGTGISARIEIPTLKDLNKISEQSSTLKAELTFSPLNNSYDDTKPLMDSLAVYVVDHKNRIINQLTDINSNVCYAILNQNDDEFNENTFYRIDMSGFVETILSSTYDLNYALMIQFIDYDKTVNSVVIESFDEKNNNIKLSVTYLNY
ncbi:protein of unknown function [Flaviramulus basaltis]|uniref:DUF4270 domain-containing protein n=1 Tax=Flaviramulus basaltis TaxID=369401 RepID=A0A1K2IQC8_9FLAO|nr:DUF4270 family protein [Flaviramulus basaltis]SFZ93899.1 protein of unknown function [Flaviramulus basaltis]